MRSQYEACSRLGAFCYAAAQSRNVEAAQAEDDVRVLDAAADLLIQSVGMPPLAKGQATSRVMFFRDKGMSTAARGRVENKEVYLAPAVVFDHVSKPECVSELVSRLVVPKFVLPKVRFEHAAAAPELVCEHAAMPKHVFEHAAKPELVADGAKATEVEVSSSESASRVCINHLCIGCVGTGCVCMRRVCASCFRKVVKGSDSIVPAVYAPPAVVPRLVYKHISEPEGVSEFASKHVVPEFALECVGIQRPDGSEEPECVSVPEFVLGRASSPDVVFELVPEPECVSDHACMLKLEVEHVSEPECVSERVSEPELVFICDVAVPEPVVEDDSEPVCVSERSSEPEFVFGITAAPKRLFEHVSEQCVVEHVPVSKLVYKHVSRPKGVSELASKLVVPKLVDKRVSRPMCVSDPVSELVVLNAVFERVSEPKCVSARASTPKLVFERVSEPECVSEHSPSLNHVFEHVSEPESVSDHVSLPKPVRERVSKPECVSQHVPAPKLAFEHASKPECVSVRASAPKLVFKHSYATELVFYYVLFLSKGLAALRARHWLRMLRCSQSAANPNIYQSMLLRPRRSRPAALRARHCL